MRRTVGLTRGGELAPGAPLRRRTGLRANPAPSPPPRRNTGPSAEVRALVLARCGGWCEWPGCIRPAQDQHHRLNRKIGGRRGAMHERINGPAWLLGCCRPHHEAVTSPVGEARAHAERTGWLLREGQDAERVPVLTRHALVPVLLTDKGRWSLAC